MAGGSMSKPYLLWSDSHFHNWSAFAETTEDGVNSRLALQIQEARRAYSMLKSAGGDTAIHAGDLFHVRGNLKPSVLNTVDNFFQDMVDEGFETAILSGNHDLESNDSKSLTSAVTSLKRPGVEPVSYVATFPEQGVVMVPWHSTVDKLVETLEKLASSFEEKADYDLIIHAPVNDVIINIPNTGLNPDHLAALGFRRVFAGHYHNDKSFCDGKVYSIGALCHQTWGDVGSQAGFMLVWPDKVKFIASSIPQFVRLPVGAEDEDLFICDGNYVRADIEDPTPERVNELRKYLLGFGAVGVTVRTIIKSKSVREGGSTVTAMDSLGESIIKYTTDKYDEDVAEVCEEIFKEVSEL